MSYEFLTTNEAARLLGVSRPLVIQWIDSGQLKGFRIPGSTSRRIPRQALVDFAKTHGIPLSMGNRRRSLLIVDDDKAFAEGLSLAIRRADSSWEISYATSGFEAGKLIAQTRPSVVLLDIRLMDVDGRKICAMLRLDPLLSGVRILAMSGYLSEAEEKRLRQQGFDDYLRKPFKAQALLAKLEAPAETAKTGEHS